MDIDQRHFYPRLLSILRSIADAEFISLDLEMSGISTKQFGRDRGTAKPSLEEQYQETKAAAEKYQILQLGITCVSEDRKRKIYVAKPYNFNVSPLFLAKDKLSIHRDITLSSSAIQFLLEHQFDMGAVFSNGVTYLSREEYASARHNWSTKVSSIQQQPDIVLRPGDNDARAFQRDSRTQIKAWIEKGEPNDYVNIGSFLSLNAFQRRLIYQLVRSEFPSYRAFSKSDGEFIQIVKLDPEREAKILNGKIASFDEMLGRQKGISWIFEALSSGDLSGLKAEWFCLDDEGQPMLYDIEATKKQIAELQKHLQANKTRFLIGHNLLTDLMYIMRTFVGSLPDTVWEFKKQVFVIFPGAIIDTKFMATQAGGSLRNNSSLNGLSVYHDRELLPAIYLDEKHLDYISNYKNHEAGYDSWLTAKLFVKLAAKLGAQANAAVTKNDVSDSEMFLECITAVEGDANGVPLNPPDTDVASPLKPGSSQIESLSHPGNQVTPVQSRFSTSNAFAVLIDQSEDSDSGGVSVATSPLRHRYMRGSTVTNGNSNGSLMDADIHDDMSSHPPGWHATQLNPAPAEKPTSKAGISQYHLPGANGVDAKGGLNIQQWIPDRDSPFWELYVDKLRVYGTEGEVCDLRDVTDGAGEEEDDIDFDDKSEVSRDEELASLPAGL